MGERGAPVKPSEARAEQAGKSPIIRNQVFASRRTGDQAGRAPQSTFRGHFRQSDLGEREGRHHHHHHHLGIVLGFVGPLFWPYAYDDFVDYTFSPYAYDTFWPYAFDDVYAGIYGGYAPEYYAPEDAYAYAGSSASEAAYTRSSEAAHTRSESGSGSTSQSIADSRICSGEAQGVTDFSIQKIEQQVAPDQQQQALLDDLKATSVKAVEVLQQACPTELPSTPTGRLAAMQTRVDAMLKAVQIVRPALDKFYASLSDEQRERFIAVDQGQQQTTDTQRTALDRLCKGQEISRGGLPVSRIERSLHLSEDQEAGLKALDQATEDAAKLLQANCQPSETLAPTARLAAMEDRLSAMSKALQTTQAALTKFYGSLSDEQKARFDRISVRPA